MQSTPEAICVIFMKIAVTHNKSKIIFKINPLVRYSWEFCNMFENTFFIEQNWTTDSEPTSSIHPAHNLQSSFKIAKKKIITCYMICMQVDLAKYLFKVLGISDQGALVTDRIISVNCRICMRHICIYKCIVDH